MRALLVLSALASVFVIASVASAQAPYPQEQYAPPPGQQQYAYPQNQGVYLSPQGGYGTAQVPPQVVAMQQELAMQQQRYASYSLGGPIALMVVGLATFLVGGLFWIGYSIGDALDSHGGPSWETTASGLVSLGGLVLGLVGIGWLVATSSDRAPIGRRIKELKQQLHALGVMASLDLAPVPGGAVGSVRFAL